MHTYKYTHAHHMQHSTLLVDAQTSPRYEEIIVAGEVVLISSYTLCHSSVTLVPSGTDFVPSNQKRFTGPYIGGEAG